MERLKRRTDFRAAAAGSKAPSKAFVLQARRRLDSGTVRFGFTVSKQVGNAVERNRVRRRLREVVRLVPAGSLHTGYDYVLIGRRSALVRPFSEMMQELGTALRRIHAKGASGAGESLLHEAGSPATPRPQNRAGRPPKSAPKTTA